MRIGYFVAGVKGASLFRSLHDRFDVAFVASYQPSGTLDDSFEQTREIARRAGYPLFGRHADPEHEQRADLIFVAGWQFLFPAFDTRYVVFHDSLLPKYRGFAPTVTALIEGDSSIGVSAIAMSDGVDAGAMYAQKSIEVRYPIRVRDAYAALAEAYAFCGMTVAQAAMRGELRGVAQDEMHATFSLWRDGEDFFLDWTADASRVVRTIHALGWPYAGARTRTDTSDILVLDAAVAPERLIVGRVPGKLFSANGARAVVVCGTGLVEILDARRPNGDAYEFTRLRTRLR